MHTVLGYQSSQASWPVRNILLSTSLEPECLATKTFYLEATIEQILWYFFLTANSEYRNIERKKNDPRYGPNVAMPNLI